MKKGFLERFIEMEQYQQNSCLSVNKFIEYCKIRGIETNEQELEFLEKEGLFYPLLRIKRPIGEEEWISIINNDGKSYSRPAEDGLKEGEKEIERYTHRYYSEIHFINRHKELLLEWIRKGVLFDPSTEPFQEWSSFKGEKLWLNDNNKIVSLYISYQIYWLDILKKNYSMKISLSSGKLIISSPRGGYYSDVSEGSWELNNFDDLFNKFKTICNDDCFRNYFDIKVKNHELKKLLQDFNCILEFLIAIQNIYAPYGRSGAKEIQLSQNAFDSDTWPEKRKKFDPKNELEVLNTDIKTVFRYYQLFSEKSIDLLGDGRAHDWIQLWKNIRWNKKDLIKGSLRLGIEYMQWVLMLKRFIEDYREKEILDVDEVIKTEINYALECDPYKVDSPFNLRSSRNRCLSDESKNYYNDINKRLFYLVNDFGLDYQPRIIVFVEGYTEEVILPEFFEWCYGGRPEHFGIEFINFEGIDKLLSTSRMAEDLKKLIYEIQKEIEDKAVPTHYIEKLTNLIKKLKSTDIIVSNFTSFISYNLEKWQIIPFFIADDEGNIKHFLEAENPIRYDDQNYNVPSDWRFLWGVDNENKPFKGSSFEFSNYNDEEISSAVGEVLGEEIEKNLIKSRRDEGVGIKKISDQIFGIKKIEINKMLCKNLLTKLDKSKDEDLMERPVFKIIKKIYEMAAFNYLPVDRQVRVSI
jgi:hypothetical protein